MSVTPDDEATAPSGEKRHRLVYAAIGVALIALLAVGIVAYGNEKDTKEARDKAHQLEQAFALAGLPSFAGTDVIVNVLGSDGGPVCEDPGTALAKAQLKAQLTNGAGGPAMRPTTIDRRVVTGEALILGIYCPDRLADYRKLIDGFSFDDTIRR